MSIISHELVYSEPNGTRLDVRYRFIDHLGVEIFVNKLVAVGFDTEADMLALIPSIEKDQAEQEVTVSVSNTEIGISPDIVPDYQLQADFDRRALGQFMTLNVEWFNQSYPLFLAMELRGGANAGQRADYLGISLATYSDIESRYNDLAGVQFFLEDTKQQQWDGIPEEIL